MRNISEKILETIKTNILSSIFFSDNSTVYGILWKNVLQPDIPQKTLQLRRNPFACWIHKGTDTHAEYVMLFAFPRQHGYASAPQFCVARKLPILLVALLQSPPTPLSQNNKKLSSSIPLKILNS